MTKMRRAAPVPAPNNLAHRLPEFYAALHQQRQFRLEQLRELADAAGHFSPGPDDVHDQIGQILRSSATAALDEVDAALDRVSTGRYGICERCTQPIAHERLEILPMSRYCMRCQHAHEKQSG